ncbi:MAG: hypothetical protein LBS29_06075 [Endomicrobium sp.]|jgi:hypothetical protein|nr:hypothetical protein [Endomicrobium sp.]
MRKIKNFKVNLRIKEISRVVKKLNNISEVSVEFEEVVKHGCQAYSKFLRPSAVYDTFSKDYSVLFKENTTLSKFVACSVFFVTVGDNLEEEYKLDANAFGEYTSTIVFAVAMDALEQSKNFIQRLISNEAKDESCEISSREEINKNMYGKFSKMLPVEKINVDIVSGEFRPKYSACGLFYWMPSKKKQKNQLKKSYI